MDNQTETELEKILLLIKTQAEQDLKMQDNITALGIIILQLKARISQIETTISVIRTTLELRK